jgi:hypothetical protein
VAALVLSSSDVDHANFPSCSPGCSAAPGERFFLGLTVHVVTLDLIASDRPDDIRLSAGAISDAVWAHALPADRLEHVHVMEASAIIEITLFLLSGSRAEAERSARTICRRLLSATPPLAGWRLRDER